MTVLALTDNATGSVISWGHTEFTPTSTQTVTEIYDQSTYPGGPEKYVKVVANLFAPMSQAERDLVDQWIPERRIIRVRRPAEMQVTTGPADANNGWSSAFAAPLQCPALRAGDYQLAITFELALLASATWNASGPTSAAQVRLLQNGSEIMAWLSSISEYDGRCAVFSATVAEGARPTFDVQIRRLGAAATARMRRLALTIAPVAKPHVDVT